MPAKTKTPKTNANAEQALAAVLEMFESGDLPEAISQTVIRSLTTDAPCNKWSLSNQLITLLIGQTHDARGFKQWQDAGRHVAKGGRAFYILGPMVRTIREENGVKLDPPKRIVTGFRGIPVHRFEDTEPNEDGGKWDAETRPAILPPLFDVAEQLGVSVEWATKTDITMFRGYYAPATDPAERRIVLVTHDVRTFFHELAHAAHQVVAEESGRELKGGQQADQEIVAETVAATLCHLYDFDGFIHHGAEYIASYASEEDGKNAGRAAMRVLKDVKAVLDLILRLNDTRHCAECGADIDGNDPHGPGCPNGEET